MIARPRRTVAHEILVLPVEPGALEDVQNIVHVEFRQAVRRHGAHKVGVAAVVEIVAGQHAIDVRVAARAQKVVDAPAIVVDAVAGQAVGGDGRHWPQIGQGRPQAVEHRHVRGLELAGARGPQPLARIVEIPQVEVADLRSLDRDDAKDVARRHFPGPASTDRDDEGFHQAATHCVFRDPPVKRLVDLQRRAGRRLIGRRKVLHGHALRWRPALISSARSGRSVVKTSTPRSNILAIAAASLQAQPPIPRPAWRTFPTVDASSTLPRRPSMGTPLLRARSITVRRPISVWVSGVTSQTWRIGLPWRGTSAVVPSWKLVITVRSSIAPALSAAMIRAGWSG